MDSFNSGKTIDLVKGIPIDLNLQYKYPIMYRVMLINLKALSEAKIFKKKKNSGARATSQIDYAKRTRGIIYLTIAVSLAHILLIVVRL